MPYLLIEDGFADNRKIVSLSDKAFRLHLTALVYCARNLTDGAISEIALRLTGANCHLARPKQTAKALVKAGLWDETAEGWQIHDYLKHNPSRREMEEKRASSRLRQAKYRRSSNASRNAVTRRVSNAWQDPPQETPKGVSLEREPSRGSLKTYAVVADDNPRRCPHCGVVPPPTCTLAEHIERTHQGVAA